MKKLSKITAVVLSAVLITMLFAACSNNAENTNATVTQKVKVIDINLSDEEYAFGVDKNQPDLMTAANELIAEIKSNGQLDEICNKYFAGGTPTGVESAALDTSKDQLVVATNAEFEPFEYKKGDTFYGIDMEIAQLLADKLGKELVIQDMKFDAVLLSVQQQKCDIGMAGLTVSEERQQQVDFTDSYYSASQRLIVKGDDTTFDNCKTKEDVEAILNTFDSSVKIGGQNGTTGQSYVQGSEDLGFPGLKATFVGYDNGSLAVTDLMNGNVNYVIIDAAPAQAITDSINAVA
ncbi:MAG: transporter substrate-binding domain-containing protein [Clostridiales bacterium]|nr:transporter substrate-binding domain-containing protein [Clostridiales bacterium]